ncbi:electron carrier/ protein disulfide oxidoreductase [Trifolium repens]|nr:electron carrier/ protein disulfide oxidoreductase [Trifolium repens]
MGSEVEQLQHNPNPTTNTNINKLNENKDTISTENNANGNITVTKKTLSLIQPHSLLPKPTPPISNSHPQSTNPNDVVQLNFKTFFRQRSNDLTSAITRTISSIKNSIDDNSFNDQNDDVKEFKLSGLKVVVTVKNDASLGKVRITLFSRSNCRDCSAVRRFFRERGLKFVEINIDVYTEREKELNQRIGNSNSTVPMIFFNEKLIGGLVELNTMRKNGELEKKLVEIANGGFSGDVPVAPAYGFDEVAEEKVAVEEEIAKVVRVLRQRLPIQDRLMKMKIVRNCFDGSELVELLVRNHGYVHDKAVEVGKELCKKHFIHSVFGENDFEEGNHFYRFLEHEPFISKCFNFRGATNDSEPKSAAAVCDRLTKIMYAILESYASEDRRHVDYLAISKSEEFRRYVNMTQDLQRVDLLELSENETLAFFLNLHNAMVIHAMIRVGCQEGVINRKSFSDFQYLIGGHPYSLATITNGILRSNRRSPYSLVKPFGTRDRRLEVAVVKMNPLIHFGLCNGTKSSPKVRFFSPCRVAEELRCAAREFFENDGIEVDLEKRTLHLTPIIKWYSADFGNERNIVKWIMNYLDANKVGLLTHLLADGGPVHISYKNYDWSINS